MKNLSENESDVCSLCVLYFQRQHLQLYLTPRSKSNFGLLLTYEYIKMVGGGWGMRWGGGGGN